MTKVFIGGSRHISALNKEIQSRLAKMADLHYSIIVGDANGVDKAVQAFLQSKGYRNVEVFCSAYECRNNLGNWPVRSIQTNEKHGTFGFYSSKDRAMADEATVGFMIWDGKSKGTPMNVLRLIQAGKSATVYIDSFGKFVSVKSASDWEQFLAVYGNQMRQQIEQLATSELRGTRELQPVLF